MLALVFVLSAPAFVCVVVLLIETQPSRFVRHTRRCEAEFPVPISDAGACVPHTRTGTHVGAGWDARWTYVGCKKSKKISPPGDKRNSPLSRSKFFFVCLSAAKKEPAGKKRAPPPALGLAPTGFAPPPASDFFRDARTGSRLEADHYHGDERSGAARNTRLRWRRRSEASGP